MPSACLWVRRPAAELPRSVRRRASRRLDSGILSCDATGDRGSSGAGNSLLPSACSPIRVPFGDRSPQPITQYLNLRHISAALRRGRAPFAGRGKSADKPLVTSVYRPAHPVTRHRQPGRPPHIPPRATPPAARDAAGGRAGQTPGWPTVPLDRSAPRKDEFRWPPPRHLSQAPAPPRQRPRRSVDDRADSAP